MPPAKALIPSTAAAGNHDGLHELLLTAPMMEFSCILGWDYYGMVGRNIAPADPGVREWIAEEFSRLWYLRSRSGGLCDTKAYLENITRMISRDQST